ncbi:MAG: glutaredoxin family protein [Pseudomonadota bacterium]
MYCNPRLLMTCMVLLSCVPCAVLSQTLYKSVGPDGKVVYSDKLPTEGRVEKMKFQNLPATPLPQSVAATYAELLRKAKANPVATAPVAGNVLYSATWCGYCRQAKAYLASKGLAYTELDIDTPAGMASFAQVGGGKGVPLLMAGGQKVQGYSAQAYDSLFSKIK